MQLSVNSHLINKADLSTHIANHGFENRELSKEELAEIINLGQAFTCQLKGSRCNESFLVAGFVALDFDETWPIDEALTHPYIQQYGSLFYTTHNHQKNGNGDRFRIVFELAEPIYDAQEYCQLIEGLLTHFPQADTVAKDLARVWFGSKDSNPIIMEGILSRVTMNNLIVEGKEAIAEKEARKKDCSYNLPLEEAEKMLTFINPMPGYEVWRNICFALGNAYDEDAIPIIEAWSPDYKHKGKHLRQLVRRADGRITLGTVLYHAIQGGYTPPPEFIKKRRTAEQVAFQDVYDRGTNYATIGTSLYHYENGQYIEIPDPLVKRKIAEYFNVYPTGEGQNKYATDLKVKSALNFVKSLLQIPGDLVNPPGVNLNNGFLQPTYSRSEEVEFTLLSHTPSRYCTYKAVFDYLPCADPTEFQKIMDNMLPSPYQEILFRVLGASLDLQEVRKRKGREARLLLLYGTGSNGKDTIKEWISMLYAGHGVTSVTLQAFKRGDGPGNFALAPLVYSRLNWSSENAAISIDHCQTLKNFASGDEITVEEKNKQGFTLRPKAVGLFNINELPHIETTQEAISSRFAMIKFPYTFTKNPLRPNERNVNPRIKGDPEFIQNTILPALLNRIIQGFKDILKSGVDYSTTDDLMKMVREENSHLVQFIEEEGLVECSHNEGITAREIFLRYETWCKNNGLVDFSSSDLKTIKRNDPSPYDKILTSETQVQQRFRKLFPGLDTKRHGKRGRILNLKFLKDTPY